MLCDAGFSPDRGYRYWLTRNWSVGPLTHPLVVIGLNPSTADEKTDDPTIRRCIGYGKLWGHDGLVMLNLFAIRGTDPEILRRPGDMVGPDNDRTLLDSCESRFVLAAWGDWGRIQNRAACVREMLDQHGVRLHCLGTNKSGHPKHPLYLRRDAKPIELPRPAL